MRRRPAAALMALLGAGLLAACSTGPGNQYGNGGTTGAVQVHDSMVGTKKVADTPDTSGFTVTLGAAEKGIAQRGVASFTGIAPGDYTVTLGGTMANCVVTGGASQSVQVLAGYIQYLTFVTTCN